MDGRIKKHTDRQLILSKLKSIKKFRPLVSIYVIVINMSFRRLIINFKTSLIHTSNWNAKVKVRNQYRLHTKWSLVHSSPRMLATRGWEHTPKSVTKIINSEPICKSIQRSLEPTSCLTMNIWNSFAYRRISMVTNRPTGSQLACTGLYRFRLVTASSRRLKLTHSGRTSDYSVSKLNEAVVWVYLCVNLIHG